MQHNDAQDFLAHYGKLGMHWGRRSGTNTTSLRTQVGQVATGGLYLGKKDRYKTPEAQRLRKSAGGYRTKALSLAGASMLTTTVAMLTNNPSVRTGAHYLTLALTAGADAASIGATIQGVRAVNANK